MIVYLLAYSHVPRHNKHAQVHFSYQTLAADPVIAYHGDRSADNIISVGGSQDYRQQMIMIPDSAKDSIRPSDSYNPFRSQKSGTEEATIVSPDSEREMTRSRLP